MPRANPSCTITTSLGNFTAEIFLRQVPLTAANFDDFVEGALAAGKTAMVRFIASEG